MKKLLFATGLSLFGFTATHAQTAQQTGQAAQATPQSRPATMQNIPPENIADMRTARLDRIVTLTDDQKKKIHEIFLNQAKSGQNPNDFVMELNDDVKTVLTPEQQEKYKTMMEQRQQMMQRRRAAMQATQTTQGAQIAPAPASTPSK